MFCINPPISYINAELNLQLHLQQKQCSRTEYIWFKTPSAICFALSTHSASVVPHGRRIFSHSVMYVIVTTEDISVLSQVVL
jgi:hypothetical protein